MKMSSTQRQTLERKIVQHLIDTALAAGWTVPYVDDGGERGNLGFGANRNGKVQGFTLGFYGNNGQCGLPIESPMAEINWA